MQTDADANGHQFDHGSRADCLVQIPSRLSEIPRLAYATGLSRSLGAWACFCLSNLTPMQCDTNALIDVEANWHTSILSHDGANPTHANQDTVTN